MPDFAKDLEIASDPSAEPEILAGLERSPDPAIREALTSNPNTPAEVLLRLGAEFPAQLLDNPLFALLLLENPNIATTIPLDTLKSLVKQENVPTAFIVEYALKASDRESLLELTFKPNLPRNALERLVKASDAEIAQAARLHVNWCAGIELGSQVEREEAIQATRQQKISRNDLQALKWLAKLGIVPDFMAQAWMGDSQKGELAIEVAKSLNISALLARQLASSEYGKARLAIASNPATHSEFLLQMAKEPDEELLLAIAANPSTPSALLAKLAEGSERAVLLEIAANPSTPLSLLQSFSENKDRQFRASVARNRSTPEQILTILSQDLPFIRHNVAKNPSTPPEILDLLAEDKTRFLHDPTPWISVAVARNPNTRVNTFIKMMQDPDEYFRRTFLHYFKTNPTIGADELIALSTEKPFQLAVASHPNLPLEQIETYFRTGKRELYLALIENNATPAHILDEILAAASKDDLSVRRMIASHPQTPRQTLEALAVEEGVRLSLQQNPNLPEDLCQRLLPLQERIDKLAQRYIGQNHPDALTWALRYFAKFDSKIINLVIICHERADAEFLATRANSRCWLERWAIAKHPKTPERILRKLTQDTNRIVRQNALAQLSAGIANLKYKSEC